MKSRTMILLIITICTVAVFCQMPDPPRNDPMPDPPRVNKIMDEFLENKNMDMKSFYKTWHFAYNKKYDYNTVEGINKYLTFKANVKAARAHNAKNLSWKEGVNEYSDMTSEEFSAHFNLDKGFPQAQEFRKLLSLDDYEDEQETTTKSSTKSSTGDEFTAVDWREHTLPVRNQGSCGSCWSFTIMANIETNYNIDHKKKPLTSHLSTQYLVDCNSKNWACRGGWFHYAADYLVSSQKTFMEKDYPYKTRQQSCASSNQSTIPADLKVMGKREAKSVLQLADLISKGSVWVIVDGSSGFRSYRSGVFSGSCSRANHAVLLVGYGYENGEGHYIIRNSWGANWGDNGHIRVKKNSANKKSCFIESTDWYKPWQIVLKKNENPDC